MNFISRFRNYQVEVDIDPPLLTGLNCMDKTSTSRRVNINLHNLIYSIGLIQSRRLAPSERNKFRDKSDLIELLYTNNNDFRIRIDEIRNRGGVEDLKSVSEDFGVGLSVVVASALYNVKASTIQRIIGTNGAKRPDWSCQTRDERLIIMESKGTISPVTARAQLKRALMQKNMLVGDVRIASSSLLKENSISSVTFVDPPLEDNNMSTEDQRRILRAAHYESVFSFLGHVDLSRYFGQMKKRLRYSISRREQLAKDAMFFNIRDNYVPIFFHGHEIRGTFSQIETTNYMFTGVDVNLVSFEGFLNFQDYPMQIEEDIADNHYTLFEDGILVIEITNIRAFQDVVNVDQIINYQDQATIQDVDQMNEVSFEKLIRYILDRAGLRYDFSENNLYRFGDVTVYDDGIPVYIELKLFNQPRSKAAAKKVMDRLENIPFIDGRYVMITNVKVQNTARQMERNMILIDRDKLVRVLGNHLLITEMIR